MDEKRFIGTLISASTKGGFGWIKPDDGGADDLVHIREVKRVGLWIGVGDRLSYVRHFEPKKNKTCAEQLRLIKAST
jgi:cold shock CspA family protein